MARHVSDWNLQTIVRTFNNTATTAATSTVSQNVPPEIVIGPAALACDHSAVRALQTWTNALPPGAGTRTPAESHARMKTPTTLAMYITVDVKQRKWTVPPFASNSAKSTEPKSDAPTIPTLAASGTTTGIIKAITACVNAAPNWASTTVTTL